MLAGRKQLTPKSLALLAAGLVILVSLSVWRLGFTGFPPIALLEVFAGPTMGTSYTVKIVVDRNLDRAERDQTRFLIEMELENVDAKMSTYRTDSELSRFNASLSTDPFPLSPDTIAVFALAQAVSEETNGAFDVTVGPLVNAWGFGPDPRGALPTDEQIAALLERVGYQKLIVDAEHNTVRKTQPDLYCDLSAIAKGYAVDRVAAALDDAGYDRYMVEVGGETKTRGHNPDGVPWRIGIERPVTDQRAVQRVVPLVDAALATSGDYRNYYEVDGVRYSHEIDPRTGRPIAHNLVSVSVIDARCTMADAYATAFMVLGAEEGLRVAESLGLAALFIVRLPTGAFEERMTARFTELYDARR